MHRRVGTACPRDTARTQDTQAVTLSISLTGLLRTKSQSEPSSLLKVYAICGAVADKTDSAKVRV